jgi:DNA-binding LacI/PurR family transcriptional regulator
MPAVVHGSLYPSILGLPHVSRDMRQIGRQLTEYLLARGRRRIVYLVRQQVLPGDLETLDAIVEALSSAGLGLDAFTFRAIPVDVNAAEATVAALLAGDDSQRSTGIVCRGPTLADGAAKAAAGGGRTVGGDVDLVVCDYYLKRGETPRYPYPRPVFDAQHRGDLIGQILAAQAAGAPYEHLVADAPVELFVPSGYERAVVASRSVGKRNGRTLRHDNRQTFE